MIEGPCDRSLGRWGRAGTLVALCIVVMVVVGCGREADGEISTSGLRRALPSAERVGDAVGSSTMDVSEQAGDEDGWGFADTFDRPEGCDDALRAAGGPGWLDEVGPADPATADVEQHYADESYAEVVVVLRENDDEDLVGMVTRLVEACDHFEVQSSPGASIRSARFEPIEAVPVDGDAVAFEQTLVYTDVDNVYEGQVWSHDGVTAFVILFSGLDDQGRPTRPPHGELAALVRLVDDRLDEALQS